MPALQHAHYETRAGGAEHVLLSALSEAVKNNGLVRPSTSYGTSPQEKESKGKGSSAVVFTREQRWFGVPPVVRM
jgi:hypothetical protein